MLKVSTRGDPLEQEEANAGGLGWSLAPQEVARLDRLTAGLELSYL